MQKTAIDVDALISELLAEAVSALDGRAPLLAGMARYHLGWVDDKFAAIDPNLVDRGKRIRPRVAILCAVAAGGAPATAAPLAAALELLHNFTLVHDDIQDHSPTRRHRPTVWSHWGVPQAINAGDALFAAAHLALYRLRNLGVDAESTLTLADAFARMTIEIVAGQVLDLSFESRHDVAPDEYLTMITGKTAAIVRYAAWGGALLGGADEFTRARYASFGLALGLGFQIQDDLLGIWGTPKRTGKAAADDIRRKKQSLPMLILRELVTREERAELDELYAEREISSPGIRRVLELLNRHEVRGYVEEQVRTNHDRAVESLNAACPDPGNPAKHLLLATIESLASREN